MKNEVLFWLWLVSIKGIGKVTGRLLLKHFRNPELIYKTSLDELMSIKELNKSKIELIINSRSLEEARELQKSCNDLNIRICTLYDENYPLCA